MGLKTTLRRLFGVDDNKEPAEVPNIDVLTNNQIESIKYNDYDTSTTALDLYDLGFHVIPLDYGTKVAIGYWKHMQTTRLTRETISEIFSEKLNVGVIAGRHSRNLFVIDCDSSEVSKDVLEKLKKYDLAQWVVSSSRGIHIWLLSKDGVVRYLEYEDLQILGNNLYFLAPPSLHPSGVIYTWKKREGELPPSVSADEMRKIFPEFRVSAGPDRGLPPTARRVLEKEDISGYKSNSEAEYATVCSLIRSGWDDDSIIDLFEEYQPEHYSSKGRNAHLWLQSYMIDKARKELRINNPYGKLESAICWVNEQPWPGIKGSTDRLVLLACCERARMESPNRFRASHREISELAGITRKTASKSLKRLTEAGYIIFKESNILGSYYALSKDVLHYTVRLLNLPDRRVKYLRETLEATSY